MPLSLRILTIKGNPVSEPVVIFNNNGSIGRLGNNTLVLPDPDKFVSRKHALINYENQQYLLKDLSLSGTYIDQQQQSLGTNTQVLSDGMLLRIGHYEVLVSISISISISISENIKTKATGLLDKDDGLVGFINDENNELNKLLNNQQDSPFSVAKVSTFESLADANLSPLHDSFIPPIIQSDPLAADSQHEQMPEDFNFEDLFVSESSIPQNATSSTNLQDSSSIKAKNNNQLCDFFLQGAGLSKQKIETDNASETMQRIGLMFRKLVSGMMSMLTSRTELKNMFRVSQTYIQTQDNNVLKFASSTNEALDYLITNNENGFKDSLSTIDEGFEDIMQHQMAMQAAIQVSLQAMLKQFDPQLIDQQFEESLLLQKKSKCWEKYVHDYPHLKSQALDDFFGETFANAYEQKITQLKQKNTQ